MNNNQRPWLRSSTPLIFAGLVLGAVAGGCFPRNEYPALYEFFTFLSKSFISLIKSIVIPILVATIVTGIAQTGNIRAVGRMGGKALLYFEVVTTLALLIGLGVANWLQPGKGLPINLSIKEAVAAPVDGWELALHAIPSNFFKHAVEGNLLAVVVFAALIGVALTRSGEGGKPVQAFFDGLAQVMFKYTDLVMRLTPFGVFGAMAYNVSHMAAGQLVDGQMISGWSAVFHLLGGYARLVGSLYLGLGMLFALVFLPVMLLCGLKPFGFLQAIKEPVLTAFSTASSEAALPRLLENIVAFGVPRRIASFVIPLGYSFNLDGSTLYLVLASLTIAQAAGIELGLGQQIAMVFTLMLASKGLAGVPRAVLVVIAGTCASFGLPGEAGIAMLLAVDEVMDMGRTAINVVGNGLAAVVIAKWERAFGTETEASRDTACPGGAVRQAAPAAA